MILTNPLFSCYFGNAKNALNITEYLALSNVQDILFLPPFTDLKKTMSLKKLIFLRQVHSTHGISLHNQELVNNHPPVFTYNGDYIITNQQNIGLGIITADCLPIIIIDQINSAIGIAHAGWRGTVAGIGAIMLADMHRSFGTQASQVQFFFGPCAKVCCYKVNAEFQNNLKHISSYDKLIVEQNNQLYFDIVQCNRRLLENAGATKNSFGLNYNLCTICDSTFFSHRRGDTGRQMTIVSLT